MPLIKKFTLVTEGYVAHAEQKLIEASQPPKPPEPILLTTQQLARLSPQPDRLVAIRAAACPLFEAARPLLAALADMSTPGDTEEADSLQPWLLQEVGLFQSICHDAGFRREATVSASYVLCTALDAARAGKAARHPTVAPSLANHFHADNNGGIKVFRLVGWLVNNADTHMDLLELVFVVLRFGFEGVYGSAANGRRELENMLHRIHDIVSTSRRNGSPELFVHWQVVESFISDPEAAVDSMRSMETRSHRPAQ